MLPDESTCNFLVLLVSPDCLENFGVWKSVQTILNGARLSPLLAALSLYMVVPSLLACVSLLKVKQDTMCKKESTTFASASGHANMLWQCPNVVTCFTYCLTRKPGVLRKMLVLPARRVKGAVSILLLKLLGNRTLV